MTELWRTARDTVAPAAQVLAEASAALGDGAAGWLAFPTALTTVRLDGGVLRIPTGPARLDGAFAVRLFGPATDLRWVQTGGGRGRAVLVTEQALDIAGWTGTAVPVTAALHGTYAVWGRRFTPHPEAAGWCIVNERRTGPLHVPVTGPQPAEGDDPWPAQYLELTHCEYVGLDTHGNAHVVEERLTGFRAATPTTGQAVRQ
ncbi:MAG: hypothetical protein JNM77_00165 [Pseudonocardia sp.]|nr:hypothetical protein [Pseudonocardia sp.]